MGGGSRGVVSIQLGDLEVVVTEKELMIACADKNRGTNFMSAPEEAENKSAGKFIPNRGRT